MKQICTALFLVFASSCASAPKDYAHMESAQYRARPELTGAFIGPGKSELSEQEIQRLLTSKVTLPAEIQLAVVRLSGHGGMADFQRIDEELASEFYRAQSWGKRVVGVTPVPELILPQPATLSGLRQAAALLQSNMLLIIRPLTLGDWRYRMFEENLAKATTSLEVVLLDTRTGAVPFTSLVTETAEVQQKSEDFSNAELLARARRDSEKRAFLRVTRDVALFLARVK